MIGGYLLFCFHFKPNEPRMLFSLTIIPTTLPQTFIPKYLNLALLVSIYFCFFSFYNFFILPSFYSFFSSMKVCSSFYGTFLSSISDCDLSVLSITFLGFSSMFTWSVCYLTIWTFFPFLSVTLTILNATLSLWIALF
jgi:hypothetical protein